MKRLLFIGLRWLNYTDEIASEFRRLGFDVSFHEILPRTLLYKSTRRLNERMYRRLLDQHHRDIIAKESCNKYDIVVFIQAHQLSLPNMETLRDQHREARFILYNWDSLTVHDYTNHIRFFDKVFTFDIEDAAKIRVNYLPLFCIRPFQELAHDVPQDGGVYFVGNIYSSGRYSAVTAFKTYCGENRIPFQCHAVCNPYQYVQLLRKGIFPVGISLSSIGGNRLSEMVQRSSAVFDIANHRQTGHTMRVIENVCMGRKIITNNPYTTSERFYSSDRVFVFKEMDFTGVQEFLRRRVPETSEDLKSYYIQAFVQKLIN